MTWDVRARSLPLLVVLLGASACGIPPDRTNTDCRWTHDPSIALDPRHAPDERHLFADAQIAEELAIRYADVHRGLRSPNFIGRAEYAAARDRCMASLIETIGRNHDVDPEHVRTLVRRRPVAFDIAMVILPMTLLFAVAADFVIRRIKRRFTPEETIARIVSLVLVSLVLDLLGYQIGTLWSLFSEGLRLQTNHLSYRAFYLPWMRHPVVIFVAGILLFWAAVFVRFRMTERQPVSSQIL